MKALRTHAGLLFLSLTFLGCSSSELPEQKAAEARHKVKTVAVEPSQSYQTQRTYTGHLRATRSSELAFQRAGMVTQVLVDRGDRVQAGQVVALLDEEAILRQQQVVRAEVESARFRLLELQRGPRVEDERAAEARLRQSETRLELARQKLARRENLYTGGAVPEEALDEARTEERAARQEVDALNQDLQELLRGTRSEVLGQARADVERAEARLQQLEVDRRDSVLRAPYSGWVTERLVDEGAVVSPGTPVLTLDESGQYEAWIDLPLDLEPPRKPTLMLAGTQTVGTLISEPPRIDDKTLTQQVRYKVSSGKPGQEISLEITEEIPQEGYWVPLDSLMAAPNGLWACYSLDQDQRVVVKDV